MSFDVARYRREAIRSAIDHLIGESYHGEIASDVRREVSEIVSGADWFFGALGRETGSPIDAPIKPDIGWLYRWSRVPETQWSRRIGPE